MRVFITGGSGMIGTELIKQLRARNHEIYGIARSDASTKKLEDNGAVKVFRASLEEPEAILKAVAESNPDAVVHCAFDPSEYVKGIEMDKKVVKALADNLVGTNKPLIICSGVLGIEVAEDGLRYESGLVAPSDLPTGRHDNAFETLKYGEKGVKVFIARLPPCVHGAVEFHGLIPMLGLIGLTTKKVPYISDTTKICAVHVDDVVSLFIKAVENPPEKTYIAHVVGEQALVPKEIAEAVAKRVGATVEKEAPADAPTHLLFFLGILFGLDSSSSSEKTKKDWNWEPKGPTLIKDILENYEFSTTPLW